jgi:hypothetical protein
MRLWEIAQAKTSSSEIANTVRRGVLNARIPSVRASRRTIPFSPSRLLKLKVHFGTDAGLTAF